MHKEQDVEQKRSSGQKVECFSTVGDGNCFFHAVFGDSSSGVYKTDKAQVMRQEWHKFLSQFESLNDPKMPQALEERLLLVLYNVFPTEESSFRTSNLYKRYLSEVSKQSYFIHVEEVPILASLAGVKVDIHSPYLIYVQEIRPNPRMVNTDYRRNQELWGNKEQEMIYLEGNHYSRARELRKQTQKDRELADALHQQEREDHRFAKALQRKFAQEDKDREFAEALDRELNGQGLRINEQLLAVATEGRVEEVKRLIEARANVDTVDSVGRTPLHGAAYLGHEKVVKLLLENQANVNVVGQDGYTPLHYAVKEGHKGIVKLLLARASINTKNKDGETALHIAIEIGNTEIAKLLLSSCDIDISAKNKYGNTVLQIATKKGNKEFVELLELHDHEVAKALQRKFAQEDKDYQLAKALQSERPRCGMEAVRPNQQQQRVK